MSATLSAARMLRTLARDLEAAELAMLKASAARAALPSGSSTWASEHLEPASPPAPEVVDVPQPIVKRLRSAEAQWCRGETVMRIEVDESGYVYAPLALLRAMLEAIDAQQGGAS
jgi:hypothetical protein